MGKLFYGLYDLANSAYTMIIITFVTSAYFANQIVGNPQLGAAYWQWTAGLCGIVIALTGPFIGALADKKPKGKINFLQIFTLLCILTTCLFWFAKPNPNYILFTLIIFFISNYCYEVGSIFYNSLLKKCSNENNIGKISGFGFALGYIGSVPIILLTLYLFVLPERVPFGLDKNNFEHIRFIPFIVALWFFIFSLPMIYYFKNKIYYEEGYTECCKMPQLEQGNVREVKRAAEKTASLLINKIRDGLNQHLRPHPIAILNVKKVKIKHIQLKRFLLRKINLLKDQKWRNLY